jgi:type II secretory pathway pseudopilin PulG
MSVVLIVIAVVIAVGLVWFLRRTADSDLNARAARSALSEFHLRLTADIIDKRRPIGDLVLTRLMCEIVEGLSAARPGAGQAALVEPPDEDYRRACEELVKLGRLKRAPGEGYFPV